MLVSMYLCKYLSTICVCNTFSLCIDSIVCIFPTPLPEAGCDTQLIFKWSKAGLNLEFLSSRLVTLPRLKNPFYLTIYCFVMLTKERQGEHKRFDKKNIYIQVTETRYK